MSNTQTEHPWRATARTIFAAVVAGAALGPAIFEAVAMGNPEGGTGYAALALAICGGITRVMALPGVNDFIERFLPFLAATPKPLEIPDGDGKYRLEQPDT
ncbi:MULTISPECIES: hypothetical protein [unclassified Arthrobacter]|uniref:hypothetical protein n=1 Tax=unclassified Arthrobacter TaxID=235627 RepID=UPI001491A547|nr:MULTISPECIES: hypothetical protein [unclassified Arthrobacter]MBE0009612.1 hypothetical protein [Arthrobacter sp. AET 35A]NOJ63363.1 hypothetical protein [Arthrobacter sp. 147(2020)]